MGLLFRLFYLYIDYCAGFKGTWLVGHRNQIVIIRSENQTNDYFEHRFAESIHARSCVYPLRS